MFHKIYKFLLQIFFPIECIECGKEETLLCYECLKKIPSRLHQPKLSSGIQISVAYGYTIPVIKKIIPRAKYYFSPQLFTDITLHAIHQFKPILQNGNGILLPVPLHYLRKQKRGFNQSRVIAECLTDNFYNWEIKELLLRKKHTSQQAKLKKKERIKNIRNAFSLNKKIIKEKNINKNTPIIIIDDVISTGSTIMEMERELKKFGFCNISALGLCRGG